MCRAVTPSNVAANVACAWIAKVPVPSMSTFVKWTVLVPPSMNWIASYELSMMSVFDTSIVAFTASLSPSNHIAPTPNCQL